MQKPHWEDPTILPVPTPHFLPHTKKKSVVFSFCSSFEKKKKKKDKLKIENLQNKIPEV